MAGEMRLKLINWMIGQMFAHLCRSEESIVEIQIGLVSIANLAQLLFLFES